MRKGTVLLVMVSVLAMSGAAGAQIYTVNADGVTLEILVIDPDAPTPAVVSTGCSNGFRSAANAIVGDFHYAENINSPSTINRVNLTDCTSKSYTRMYTVGDANNNLTADTSGALWEIDRGTGNLYTLSFDDDANTVSRTSVAALGRNFNQFGDIAWGADGLLYIATNNTSDGNFTWDGENLTQFSSNSGAYNYQGIAWYNGKLYGVTAANNGSSGPGTLWELDPADMSTKAPSIASYAGRLNDLAAWPLEEPSCETDLIAGGGNEASAIDVGSVITTDNGDGTWDVTYQTTGTWAITEVHLDVACSENDFPQTKSGNPKVGQFCFQDMIPDGTQSYTVEGIGPDFCHDSGCSCPHYFAAHAVVVDTASCDDAGAVMYGTEIDSGDLYQIDLDTGTATFISVTGPFSPDDQNQPNGAAFDPVNGRLYYSAQGVEGTTPSDLFFYDLGVGTEVFAGDLNGFDVGASFYGGAYYYIPNGTDDVNLVTLNADGTIAAVGIFLTDFTGDANRIYRFGDIAISADGILYGSTNGSSGSSAEFFTIDLGTGVYTEICDDTVTGCMHSLQLAFGSDGTLYAHSAGTGDFYAVNLADGSGTLKGKVTGSRLFSDLASGELCILRTETAWGDGTEFPGNNWATWFECDNCD